MLLHVTRELCNVGWVVPFSTVRDNFTVPSQYVFRDNLRLCLNRHNTHFGACLNIKDTYGLCTGEVCHCYFSTNPSKLACGLRFGLSICNSI